MNYDNPVLVFLRKVCDMVFLALLWGVFCLPIVTILPSCGALYYAVTKSVRHDRGRAFPMFWKSFVSNLKAGIPATIVLFIAAGLAFFNGDIALQMDGSLSILLLICDVAVFVLALFSLLWAPAVLARFDVGFGGTLKASLQLAFGEIGRTLVLLIMFAVTVVLTFISYGLTLLFLPSLLAMLSAKLTEKKLNTYIGEDENKDKWYLEEKED